MSELLNPLLSYILLYRYTALFAIVYSGSLLIPWPVNATLLAVGAFASQHYFNFWWAALVAVSANTLGDLSGYFVTRIFGERVTRALQLHRLRFFHYLTEELKTDAAVTVFTTRFASSLSTVANFLAGLAEVPFVTFFFYDLLGNIIEPSGVLILGYLVGDYWSNFSGILDLVAALVAALVIMFVLGRIYRRITRRYYNNSDEHNEHGPRDF